MASTLASLSDRVEQTLVDNSNVIWPALAITEGIRSALGEYNLAGKIDDPTFTALTIQNLDTAPATTLPAEHDTVIVWGAAGYCVQARAVDRIDSYQLGSKSADLKAWGDARLKEFKAMLSGIFPKYLAIASTSSGGADPALTAAQIALLTAQAAKTDADTAATTGQEGRSVANAAHRAADEAAEVTRRDDIRTEATNKPWGSWADDSCNHFDGSKPD